MYIYLKIRYFETFFDDKITKKKYHQYFLGGGGEGGSVPQTLFSLLASFL